jgi:hypothetical protein
MRLTLTFDWCNWPSVFTNSIYEPLLPVADSEIVYFTSSTNLATFVYYLLFNVMPRVSSRSNEQVEQLIKLFHEEGSL